MGMLVEWFNTTKYNIEFGVDNYGYEKEIQTNPCRTEVMFARCDLKCGELCKGRIIIIKKVCVCIWCLQRWRS